MRALPALLVALTLASGCRSRRRARPHRSAAITAKWFVLPAQGLPARVDAQRLFRGAVRVVGDRYAPPPWPASALVACARLPNNTWLFASEDGTIYRAPGFDGALSPLGALPGRAAPLSPDGAVASVSVRSDGGLFVVDTHRDAWTVDAAGVPRKLPLERVVHGVFTTATDVLAVTEPGVLQMSTDGGVSFSPVELPRGVALSVSVDEHGPAVRTTEGALRWADGALEPVTDVPSPAAHNALDARAADALARPSEAMPDVPWRPGAIAANPDGTVSIARRDAIVTVDPRTGTERSRVAPPGEDCVLARARDGLRAVCRHDGWATAVFALADGSRAWTLVRDESRAEPMAAAFFDRRSRAWIVAAPCRQRTEVDRHRVCYYPDAGAPVEVRLPFAAAPVSMHDGVALVIDGESGRRGSTRAALVRGASVTELWLPGGNMSAQTATLDERSLMMWDLDPAGEHVLALVRGTPAAQGWTWKRVEAPSGTRRGVFAPGGLALAAGSTAGLLAVSAHGGAFAPLRSPVDGAGEALELSMAGQWFCAGPWCRLGGNLLLSTVAGSEVTVVARPSAVPAVGGAPAPQMLFECHPDGVPVPGVEMDRGSAVSGYALRWQVQGEQVALSWYGATLQGAATVRWPGPPGELFRAIGAVSARAPAAMLERCLGGTCERVFASAAGVTALALPRTMPGTAALHASGDGWIARTDDVREGVARVSLVSLDARGAVRAERSFALASPDTHADAGTLRGSAGLWVRAGGSRLRFYPMAGGATADVEEAHAGCEGAASPEGEVYRVGEVPGVRGEDWLVDPTEWQVEERLHVVNGRACIASMAGGEPRDEAEGEGRSEHTPVRTFVLQVTGREGATARAWARRQIHPQRCALRARR